LGIRGRRGGSGSARWLAVLLVALACCVPCAAQQVLLTLLEGDADVVDGARRLAAKPGLRLAPATLVDTTATTALLRLEWPDRSVVDLGPATRAMIAPPAFAARGGQPPLIYLLQGWAKLTAPPGASAGGIVAPGMELMPLGGAAVVYSGNREQFVFAESGAATVVERKPANGAPLAVPSGALYAGAGSVLPFAAPGWLQRVPRSFRDAIPRRAAAFSNRAVDASVLSPPTYVMLADWLGAEPVLRAAFPRRFAPLARDPAFRRELQAHLSQHPEWQRVLHPPEPTPTTR
jgi:hypothetical protein